MKEPEPQVGLLTPIILGKDEMNLAEYPLSILTHRIPRHRKTYSFTQRITDHQGTVIKQSWSVLGSDKYGLPTPYDDDVLIALLYCYKEQKPQGKKIHFSLYKLCQIMQKTLSKREYDRMRDSLNRLTSTTIVATNCFYDNLAKSWVSEAFHLFDRYKLYQERKGRAASPHLSFVEMSAFFHQSVAVANYIKDLNLGIYYSLALPISKRLFRYLDKNRYKKSRYEETVMRMASKLPLTYAYPSQVKQKLARAHEELLRHGYLTHVTYDVTREGEDKVIYDFADGGTKIRRPPHRRCQGGQPAGARLLCPAHRPTRPRLSAGAQGRSPGSGLSDDLWAGALRVHRAPCAPEPRKRSTSPSRRSGGPRIFSRKRWRRGKGMRKPNRPNGRRTCESTSSIAASVRSRREDSTWPRSAPRCPKTSSRP